MPFAVRPAIPLRVSHHTGFSHALQLEHLEDFAEMLGIELVRIGSGSAISQFRQKLRWNAAAYASRT